MKTTNEIWKSLISSFLIFALLFCNPISAIAQVPSGCMLENGTSVVLRTTEDCNFSDKAENGLITAVVNSDVYSADGSTVVVKAGTPATIEFSAEANGSWGKAGKVCITNATTRTVDNKQVSLRLSSCKKGGSKIGGVIVLSVLFFPLGLISGCMKGGMPKISNGATFNATVAQDIQCSPITK